jgi:hypothetical protein
MHRKACRRDTNFIKDKGSGIISKQSNQRYRKEKEQEHLKKAGIEGNASNLPGNMKTLNKALDQYDDPGAAVKKPD